MSREPRKEYLYAPLDQGRGQQIRLLCLAAGSDDEEISGKLRPFSLDDPELPGFTALSYTWGSNRKDAAIHIDPASLPVTSNLYAALKHLRRGHEQRWVWVDAICISQADDAEKSFQVPNIHLVYQAATYCLAWLGTPSEESEIAMRGIRDIDHGLDHSEQYDPATFSEPECKGILDILERDYFKRIWIVQELVWANDVYLTCGGIEVRLDQLVKAVNHQALHGAAVSRGFGVLTLSLITILRLRLPGAIEIDIRDQNRLFYTLASKIGLKATDPRDHVYATLNLIPRSAWPSQPDYSKDVIQVFAEAAVKVIETTHSLDILRLCDVSQISVLLPREHDKCIPKLLKTEKTGLCYAVLPSWIPNWSDIVLRPSQREFEALHGIGSSLYTCAAGILSRVEIRGSNDFPLLWVHAILYDSIQTCRAIETRTMKNERAWRPLSLFALGAKDPNSTYSSGECTVDEAFWRTLMLDCNGYDVSSRATSADVMDFAKRVKEGFHWTTANESSNLLERCFLVTKTGMFGVGPELSKIGDFVAIIAGCSVPMILPYSRSMGLYQIIGEACMSRLILIICQGTC
jgi:hypothetical protein